MLWIGLILIGLTAGVLSGFLGIGGATIAIPFLVMIFGMNQHFAQGTTLAMMVPPIGLLAAWYYWKQGNVNIGWAALLALGFFVGGLVGAKYAHMVPDALLRKLFGGFLLFAALRMIFKG